MPLLGYGLLLMCVALFGLIGLRPANTSIQALLVGFEYLLFFTGVLLVAISAADFRGSSDKPPRPRKNAPQPVVRFAFRALFLCLKTVHSLV